MIRLNRKGQNTLEYVLLITAVVVAFLLIQYYLNRGLQGRVREASDNIGDQFTAEDTKTSYVLGTSSTTHDTQLPSGDAEGGNIIKSELVTPEVNTRTGSETVAAPSFP